MWLDNYVQATSADVAALLCQLWLKMGELMATYYACGKERPCSFIISAIQIVADLETPTRQCTNVAVPALRPFSGPIVSCVSEASRYHVPMNSKHLGNSSVRGSTPLS